MKQQIQVIKRLILLRVLHPTHLWSHLCGQSTLLAFLQVSKQVLTISLQMTDFLSHIMNQRCEMNGHYTQCPRYIVIDFYANPEIKLASVG